MSKQGLSSHDYVPMIAAKRKTASKRRYGAAAQRKVEAAMHEMQQGTLKSGRSGKKVSSRKQAIAIGLSEARKAGAKAPAKSKAAGKRKATVGKRKAAGKRKPAAGKRKTVGKRKAAGKRAARTLR